MLNASASPVTVDVALKEMIALTPSCMNFCAIGVRSVVESGITCVSTTVAPLDCAYGLMTLNASKRDPGRSLGASPSLTALPDPKWRMTALTIARASATGDTPTQKKFLAGFGGVDGG